MRKNLLTLICGVSLSVSTVNAEEIKDLVKAKISPIQMFFNDEKKELDGNYKILSFNDYTYVPIRFIADNMGHIVSFDKKTNSISINKREYTFNDLLYFKTVENIYLHGFEKEKVKIDESQHINDILHIFETAAYTKINYTDMNRTQIDPIIGGTRYLLYGPQNEKIVEIYCIEKDIIRINNNYYKVNKDIQKELNNYFSKEGMSLK